MLASHIVYSSLLLALPTAVHVQGHAGYGGPTWFVLSGRVLEGKPTPPPDAGRGLAANIKDTWALIETDEVEGAVVKVSLGGRTYQAKSDDDGVFVIEGRDLASPLGAGHHVLEARLHGRKGVAGTLDLHVVGSEPGVAVISDVDDTILASFVTKPIKMIAEAVSRNAAQRAATPGMPAAYRSAAAAGSRGFFYVSASPQNLYPRLRDFLTLNDFPAGPIFLKNIGADAFADHGGYKQGRIEALLVAYPQLRFVLVGDSGEADPEIYRRVRALHPERIAAIVIREIKARPLPAADDVLVVHEDGDNASVIAKAVNESLQQPNNDSTREPRNP